MFVTACGAVKASNRCSTAADCTDSSAPYCVADHCQASCSVSSDCSDPGHAVCASDGACVGCVAATDCSAQAPICDSMARACRGCTADTECSGGVCVEADGACVADAGVAFVAQMGNDAGSCTRAAPCATLPFAIAQAGARKVIHVLGGTLQVMNATFTADRVLDGEDTTLEAGGATSITIKAPAAVTIEGVRIVAPSNAAGANTPGVAVSGAARARIYGATITGDTQGSVLVAGSAGADVAIQHSHLGSLNQPGTNAVICPNAKLTVDQSMLEMTIVGTPIGGVGTCQLSVTRSRFESTRDGSVQLTDGQLVMENNLIIHRDGFNDSILAVNLRPGSTIRFNTVVNTTGTPSDGAALSCDNSVVVTSNVFAYNSGHPITGTGCETRYSVFDDQSTTAAGTGNQVTPIDRIFASRAGGDYHLAASSVARGGAEPGLTTMVMVDYDGKPRPEPAGSNADCGAFESP